ncbi:hypothetical protein F5Y11DRAFT_239245 [Daldinia sp. FL1419]|nr:hypothetical protein F5Y11DRAFT_239245 [Daldinia sp. FL1419]
MHFVWEPQVNKSSGKLESPYLFDATRDTKEETDILAYNTWVAQPMIKLRIEFEKSLRHDPAPPDPLKALWSRSGAVYSFGKHERRLNKRLECSYARLGHGKKNI